MTMIGKREFIHHVSRYLKAAEIGDDIVLTHNGKPCLRISKLRKHSINDLLGCGGSVKIHGDVNEPVLEEFFDDLA